MHKLGIRLPLVIVVLVVGWPLPASTQVLSNQHEVKQVIVMVPDGMGLADVTATRIRKNGIAGEPLAFETLDRIGYQRTYSEKNTVTDSSAAASAWACGEKFVNNEVCFHADGRPYNPTLLELAKAAGWGTGLVATQTITHATPASFGAHVYKRTCETEIARQYVQVTQPDVMLGGGKATFNPAVADACGASGDYVAQAQAQGYTFVDTRDAMAGAVSAGATRLLGLFANKNLTPEYQRPEVTTQPRLPEMTAAALALLEKRPGFFLMVEGSLVDSGNHAENLDYQYGEMVAFDESVRVVRRWIDASPARRQQTLLIVLADHETGGFAVKGTETPGDPLQPLGYFYAGWTFTLVPGDPKDFEAHHTGVDTLIWSEGPGSEALGRAIENTFVYQVVREVIR